jgi:hypothetical protein
MFSLFGRWNGYVTTSHNVQGIDYGYIRVRDEGSKVILNPQSGSALVLIPTDDIRVAFFILLGGKSLLKASHRRFVDAVAAAVAKQSSAEFYEDIKLALKV